MVDWNGKGDAFNTSRHPSFKRSSKLGGSFKSASCRKGDSFKRAPSPKGALQGASFKHTSFGGPTLQGGSFKCTSVSSFGSTLRVLPSSGHSDDFSGSLRAGGDADADANPHSFDDPSAARTDVRVVVKVPSRASERGAGPGHVGSDDSVAGQSARLASLERKVDDLLATTGKIGAMEEQLGCLCRHFQLSLDESQSQSPP